MADDISHLPPKERAKRYRVLAADARREADGADGIAVKESYRIIARQFEHLARMADDEISDGR